MPKEIDQFRKEFDEMLSFMESHMGFSENKRLEGFILKALASQKAQWREEIENTKIKTSTELSGKIKSIQKQGLIRQGYNQAIRDVIKLFGI